MAPRDTTLFSDAIFAFGEAGQDAVQTLLARTSPDGGGNTFYNLAPGGAASQARGWMDVTGSVLDPASFRATSGGIEAGADVDFGSGLRLGGGLAYEHQRLTDSGGGAASQDVYRVSLYGAQTLGAVGISADLAYGHASERLDRPTGLGVATSSRGVDDFDGAVQVAAPIAAGGSLVTPAAGLVVSDLSAGAFAETDPASAAFALTGASARGVAVSPFVALGLSHAFARSDGLEVTPDAEVGYRYDALAGGLTQTLTAADGTGFTGAARLDRSSALVGAAITAHKGAWTAFVAYRASIAADWNNQTLSAGLRVRF